MKALSQDGEHWSPSGILQVYEVCTDLKFTICVPFSAQFLYLYCGIIIWFVQEVLFHSPWVRAQTQLREDLGAELQCWKRKQFIAAGEHPGLIITCPFYK